MLCRWEKRGSGLGGLPRAGQEEAAPGLEERQRAWKAHALPDTPHCSLSHAACPSLHEGHTGAEAHPDIPGAEWRPQERRRRKMKSTL